MVGQAIDSVVAQKPVTKSAPLQEGLADRSQRSLTAFISYAHLSDTEFRNRLAEKIQADGIESRNQGAIGS
jgi:hypothetical protein